MEIGSFFKQKFGQCFFFLSKTRERERKHKMTKLFLNWNMQQKSHFLTCKWSNNRPGVATRMLMPFTNFFASSSFFVPPITNPNVWWWNFSNSFKTPYVCIDNSLVGEMTITPVPRIEMIILKTSRLVKEKLTK